MSILYKSTRGHGAPVSASVAILKGLADDGGLFVPTSIPTLGMLPMQQVKSVNKQRQQKRKWGESV